MADYSWAEQEDWGTAWDDLVAAVGQDFGDGVIHIAADPIEASAVRRYLEPLEIDCPLHYDVEAAKAHGYNDIVAPYSGLVTWASEGLWNPGDPPLWTDPSRNAQIPVRGMTFPPPAPDTDSIFQTDVYHIFLRPMVVGDRLATTGRKLIACLPKETSVGRGAFITWETQVLDRTGDVVAIMRPSAYYYVARVARP